MISCALRTVNKGGDKRCQCQQLLVFRIARDLYPLGMAYTNKPCVHSSTGLAWLSGRLEPRSAMMQRRRAIPGCHSSRTLIFLLVAVNRRESIHEKAAKPLRVIVVFALLLCCVAPWTRPAEQARLVAHQPISFRHVLHVSPRFVPRVQCILAKLFQRVSAREHPDMLDRPAGIADYRHELRHLSLFTPGTAVGLAEQRLLLCDCCCAQPKRLSRHSPTFLALPR